MLIKICGICDIEMAIKAVKLGANFVGLVFHPPSKRFVNLDQAVAIAKVVREESALPVAVFVDHTASEMNYICEKTEIKIVQLHGRKSRQEQHLLADSYQRIYVQSISENNEVNPDDDLSKLQKDRDYLLIDHQDSGQGKCFNWSTFSYTAGFRWFLAGGLTADNVKKAIQLLKPTGVDVSTGVEHLGRKTSHLIYSFIKNARGSIDDT